MKEPLQKMTHPNRKSQLLNTKVEVFQLLHLLAVVLAEPRVDPKGPFGAMKNQPHQGQQRPKWSIRVQDVDLCVIWEGIPQSNS